MIERRGGGTSLSLGVLWRKGGEESAFTQKLLPFIRMSEGIHAHQWTSVCGTREAFRMQSACVGDQGDRRLRKGGLKGGEKTLKLDSQVACGCPLVDPSPQPPLPREKLWGVPTLCPASGQSVQEERGCREFDGMDSYSPGDVAVSAALSSRGVLAPVGDATMTVGNWPPR